MEFKNKEKPSPLKEDDTLPGDRQVVITLTTQKEIDQLYALLNYIPIRTALNIDDSEDTWNPLRNFLKPKRYTYWHGCLAKTCQK